MFAWATELLVLLRDIRACLRVLIALRLAETSGGRLPETMTDRVDQLLTQQSKG